MGAAADDHGTVDYVQVDVDVRAGAAPIVRPAKRWAAAATSSQCSGGPGVAVGDSMGGAYRAPAGGSDSPQRDMQLRVAPNR